MFTYAIIRLKHVKAEQIRNGYLREQLTNQFRWLVLF